MFLSWVFLQQLGIYWKGVKFLENLNANTEETSWRQKSRLWIQKGDKNTSYFHDVATAHRGITLLISCRPKELEDKSDDIRWHTIKF